MFSLYMVKIWERKQQIFFHTSQSLRQNISYSTSAEKLFNQDKVAHFQRQKGLLKIEAYCTEHWVLYANGESWNTASNTKDVLYGD